MKYKDIGKCVLRKSGDAVLDAFEGMQETGAFAVVKNMSENANVV